MLNLKNMVLVSGASALMAVMALTGCEMTHHDTGGRTAGRVLDDKVITENVKDKLNHEPVYKFGDVDVKTFDGAVQLSGFVDTDEQRRRAGELAQSVEGVARVINNVALKAQGSTLPATGRVPADQSK